MISFNFFFHGLIIFILKMICEGEFVNYENHKTDKEATMTKSTDKKVHFVLDNLSLSSKAHEEIEIAKRNNRTGSNGILCGAALKLPSGEIITGVNSPLFHSATAVIIKACKALIGLPDDVFLLSSIVIQSIGKMKEVVYQKDEASLDVRELLIALAVESPMNPSVSKVLELFPKLKGCEMHLTHIPTLGDQSGLKKLGICFTYDQVSSS